MSHIGLIGGVSPEATKIYYELLNAHARTRHSGQHSARCNFFMLDYGVMIGHYHAENWDAFKAEVVKGAQALKAGGASAIAITSGTTHVAAAAVARETGLPVIHMLDSLTKAMIDKGIKRPLLLGTPWVMSGDFFRPALLKRYDGDPIVPGVILGCTELCMILEADDCDVPVFSTTHIHAAAIDAWIVNSTL